MNIIRKHITFSFLGSFDSRSRFMFPITFERAMLDFILRILVTFKFQVVVYILTFSWLSESNFLCNDTIQLVAWSQISSGSHSSCVEGPKSMIQCLTAVDSSLSFCLFEFGIASTHERNICHILKYNEYNDNVVELKMQSFLPSQNFQIIFLANNEHTCLCALLRPLSQVLHRSKLDVAALWKLRIRTK